MMVLVVFGWLGCMEERGVKLVVMGSVGGGAAGRALAEVGRRQLTGLGGREREGESAGK